MNNKKLQPDEDDDNEARPNDMGSGPAHSTGDATSFGGTSSIRQPGESAIDEEAEIEEADGMEVMMPDDGRLGLTDIGDVPVDDWAADTGPTRSNEED